jgi:very-short-patch-repair endonuclease
MTTLAEPLTHAQREARSPLAEALIARMPVLARINALNDELALAWDTPKRWRIIREYYRIRGPEILESDHFNPYELGLERFLTPIEVQLWQDIRMIGLPLLMQYPVGRRFVDFGDPRRQIAIEADGAAYHNPEKDAKKDAELRAAGWTVFRCSGRNTFGERGTAFIRDVARWYGIRFDEPEEDEWRAHET